MHQEQSFPRYSNKWDCKSRDSQHVGNGFQEWECTRWCAQAMRLEVVTHAKYIQKISLTYTLGRWNRGCNIPISRFQNGNIPVFRPNIQYSNFRMQLFYVRTWFRIRDKWWECSNIQYSDLKMPIFLVLLAIFNIQISEFQRPYIAFTSKTCRGFNIASRKSMR